MSGNSALYSRPLFVFALVYAAVTSFIMCSDAAARASPITTQVDNGVKHIVLRRLYTPYSQHPFFTGLPLTKSGLQTGTNVETDTRGNDREALSIIDHQTNPLQFTEGSFSYNQYSPNNRLSRAETTRTLVQSGVRPARSSQPFSGNSYNSYPVITRKASHKEAASPFQQSSSPPQVWDPKDAQKSYIKEKVPRNDSPSLFSSQTGRYWSTSLPTSRGHYSGFTVTNELAAAGAHSTSTGIQSSKFLSSLSQTAPRASSISNSLDASAIKSIPRPEKLTTSITDFSQGIHSVSSSETPRHKKVKSYLLKGSQTSFGGHETVHTVTSDGSSAFPTTPHKQRASDAQVYSRVSSNIKQLQQSERKDPTKKVQHLSKNSNSLTNSQRYSFDKGKDYKIANRLIYPSLSPKFSFGQREASTTPAEIERTPTDNSSDIIPTKTWPSPRPFTSGFEEARPLLHESDAGMDSNPDHRQFRIYKRIYGLKGFGTRPLEGAKTFVSEPDMSARVQQGFKHRGSQIWQLKSSHSTMSRNELRSEDLKPLLTTAGSTESVTRFTPDVYKNRRKIYTFLGFGPVQNSIAKNNAHKQNPTSPSPIISSAILRSAGKPTIESSPKSEPRSPNKTKSVATEASMLNSSTSHIVRGKHVKGNGKKLNEYTLTKDTGNAAIVRLPKRPARVIAITYTDIIGSASFSGVTATTQTPITHPDKDYLTATIKQKEGAGQWTLNSEDAVLSSGNTSRGPAAHAKDEVDFSSVEENKLGVSSEEVVNGMKTFDFFLDNEGSGSGAFDMSDVLSTDTSQGHSEDSLELDYLRISTCNISFKSMNLSHTEK
ncbi:uncharacterized protein LOC116048983 isoform X1 [Sander lucioperca]|uniref:uncharacterized protein LOC116048983 isoform X1 n=1 Tax=Sander lucioperca TaxID=283035 RepID=UPI00125DC88B|nr:uncharacterized protein LOC116048983 isoform X1 [Sander lucioperca]